jgi:hypothetical protein
MQKAKKINRVFPKKPISELRDGPAAAIQLGYQMERIHKEIKSPVKKRI